MSRLGQPAMKRRVTEELIRQVLNLVQRGYCTREIGRRTGLSMSAVYKIRQGRHPLLRNQPPPGPQPVWCPRCRCRVFPPCRVCDLREQLQRQELMHRLRPARRRLPPLEKFPPELQQRLSTPVAELGLPVRVVNYLEHAGILTVYDLLGHRPEELLLIPNFAQKTLEQVYRALEPLGFVRQSRLRKPSDGKTSPSAPTAPSQPNHETKPAK